MATALDRLRDRKKANHKDVPVCVDPNLTVRKSELDGKLAMLKTRLKISNADETLQANIAELEDELAELAEQIKIESEWIRIKALAPDDFQDLLDNHKPTKDQMREARKIHGPRASLGWNTETFPDAILAESAYVLTVKEYDPETGQPIFENSEDPLTAEFVKEMHSSGAWSAGELGMLVNTAITINESAANIGAAGNG
jgi:hypothetical protein